MKVAVLLNETICLMIKQDIGIGRTEIINGWRKTMNNRLVGGRITRRFWVAFFGRLAKLLRIWWWTLTHVVEADPREWVMAWQMLIYVIVCVLGLAGIIILPWILKLVIHFLLCNLTAYVIFGVRPGDEEAMTIIGGLFMAPALVPLVLLAMAEPVIKNGLIASLNSVLWIIGFQFKPDSRDWIEYL